MHEYTVPEYEAVRTLALTAKEKLTLGDLAAAQEFTAQLQLDILLMLEEDITEWPESNELACAIVLIRDEILRQLEAHKVQRDNAEWLIAILGALYNQAGPNNDYDTDIG